MEDGKQEWKKAQRLLVTIKNIQNIKSKILQNKYIAQLENGKLWRLIGKSKFEDKQ